MLNGEIDYPLNLLFQGDSPVNRFEFSGVYDGKAASLSVNDIIQVGFAEKVEISSAGIGYNLCRCHSHGRGSLSHAAQGPL